ncbi:MAG TPA: YhbY family RNA-binding protein [Polyangia bacterium]|nr:YhbY family RNA-binding protein [Polyangia bacterium]
MPATSARKRALMPTGDLRRKLRAHGHPLKPLVQVGKGGVTKGVLAQIAQALYDHELVKVRIGTECPVDRFAVADDIAAQPGTQVVQLVGRIVLAYKRHPEKPRYEGKGARDRAAEAPPAPPAKVSYKPRETKRR